MRSAFHLGVIASLRALGTRPRFRFVALVVGLGDLFDAVLTRAVPRAGVRVGMRSALAPRHRRKAPRALLPACKPAVLANCLRSLQLLIDPQQKMRDWAPGVPSVCSRTRVRAGETLDAFVSQSDGGRPRSPVSVFSCGIQNPSESQMRAQTRMPGGGGLGVIFAGAAERGLPAPTLSPPDNRPSEHSGENHSEFADDPREFSRSMPAAPMRTQVALRNSKLRPRLDP